MRLSIPPKFLVYLKIAKEKKDKSIKNQYKSSNSMRKHAREKIYSPKTFENLLVNQIFNFKEEITIVDQMKYIRNMEVLPHFNLYIIYNIFSNSKNMLF